MQDVKKILLLIFIGITHINCNSQSIVGNYKRVDPKIATTEIEEEYKFNPDSTFVLTRYMNIEQVELFKGSFSLVKDTLIIKNEEFKNNNNITTHKTQTGSSKREFFTAKIKIVDENEKPISGANLLIRNNRGEIVMVFVSDIKGEFPFLSIYDNYIHDFNFSFVGYHENIVEINKLFGHNVTMEVRLSKTKYVSSQLEKKYVLKKQTEKELVLSPLEDSEIIILEKK